MVELAESDFWVGGLVLYQKSESKDVCSHINLLRTVDWDKCKRELGNDGILSAQKLWCIGIAGYAASFKTRSVSQRWRVSGCWVWKDRGYGSESFRVLEATKSYSLWMVYTTQGPG